MIRSAIAVIAVTTAGSGVNPSWAAKRAARIIRSGSSENESSGVPGVRITLFATSAIPPYGSTNWCDGSRIAIAFMAKSRRARSPSRLSPYDTSGLREVGS